MAAPMPSPKADWPLRIAAPGGLEELVLSGPGSWVKVAREGFVEFAVPEGEHVYLCSGGAGGLSRAPSVEDLPLRPGADHQLAGEVELVGGSASLWLIEYAAGERIGRDRWPLVPGRLRRVLHTAAEADGWRLAVRLMGAGRIALSGIELRAPAEP
jgi:hypothetical protein